MSSRLNKTSIFLVGVLSVFLSCAIYQISIYEALVPILEWSNKYIFTSWRQEHLQLRACKKYGFCHIHMELK